MAALAPSLQRVREAARTAQHDTSEKSRLLAAAEVLGGLLASGALFEGAKTAPTLLCVLRP